MKYNEYKAPQGKMLLNLDDFTCGNTMLSVYELNVIVVDKEEAERLSNEYRAKQEEIIEAEMKAEEALREAPEDEINPMIDSPQSYSLQSVAEDAILADSIEDENCIAHMSDTPEDSRQQDTQLQDFKRNAIAELLLKGVKADKSDVILNQHETKYI